MVKVQSVGGRKSSPHSIRMSDERWNTASRRAEQEGVAVGHVVSEVLEGYSRGLVNLPQVALQSKETGPRGDSSSVRVANVTWAAAKRRATADGLTMNDVVSAIVYAYGQRLINLPRITKSFNNSAV